MRLLLTALLLATPAAGALAALPSQARPEATEARFALRVEPASLLRVETDGPALVALTPPGEEPGEFAPTPAELVPPSGEWHGLPGVVDLVVRRADPSRALEVSAYQGDAGVRWEWSARPNAAPLPWWVPWGALLGAHMGFRRRRM